MDIKEFIASGILEHYVLGLASEQEAQTVQQYAEEYPEVRQELNAIELALTQFAQADAIAMPKELPNKVLKKIDEQIQGPINNGRSNQKSSDTTNTKGGNNPLIWIIALVAIGLGVAAFMFYNQQQTTLTQLNDNRILLDSLQQDCSGKDTLIDQLQQQLRITRGQNNQRIFMLGTDNSPEAIAGVYYNPDDQEAYLDVINMPTIPTDKQFQLWAIVDGAPVDMGVFDVDFSSLGLKDIPFIENAQAFAVTIEDRGGSPAPSLETMVVIGNVG
ncbi:MAG: anti-sigma factor [Saprospiraceae bacterium]|nr:anti-sigma factor [Saprospiraceae bacterium]